MASSSRPFVLFPRSVKGGTLHPIPKPSASMFTNIFSLILLVVCGCLFSPSASAQIGGVGWVAKPMKFHVQTPTNAPQSERYYLTNGYYHMLIYSNDGAFSIGNTTLPRSEQRFDPDYTNGIIHYQATMKTDTNSSSVCLFQIHTGDAQSGTFGSTTFMLFWFSKHNGSVNDYSGPTLATNLAGKWFNVNCDHNLNSRTITVWIDGTEVWQQLDNGAGDFYFKDGVYEQSHVPTFKMENNVTNILIWTNQTSAVFSGYYEMKNVRSGLAATVRGFSLTNNAPVVQSNFVGSANSLWYLAPTDNGFYRVMNVNSCLALAVQNSATANGTPVVQSAYVTNGSADWQPGQNSDGTYTFTNRLSGKVLDVIAASSSQNAQLVQTNSNGNSSQDWVLIPYGNVVANSVRIPPLNPTVTNGHKLQLQFSGVPAARYVLQAATNLFVPNWQPVATNSADASGNCTFSDTNTAARSSRFYRTTFQ